MQLRAQLPVYSPLTLGALVSGARAAMSARAAAAARASVESALAAEYGTRRLLLTDSGTSALALALRAAAAERPGPAALPAFCCYDVATAADAAGVQFVLYDIDPATLGPDAESLARVLREGAGTVVVVHLYGIPVDIATLQPMLREHGAVLVEDAAQAVGARVGDRPAGAVGRYGVLSFGRGKGRTGGRGGALLMNESAASLASRDVEAGLAPSRGAGAAALVAQWLLARPSVYGLPVSLPFIGLGETVYQPAHRPAHVSPFALGVLTRSVPDAREEADVRRVHARALLDAVATVPQIRAFAAPAGSEAGYLRFPLLLPAGTAERRATTSEARRLGIWRSYPASLAKLPGFGARRGNPAEPQPGARHLAGGLVTLPTHSRLDAWDLEALKCWTAGLADTRGDQSRRAERLGQ